ncbi:NADPH:quinone oxidoreductase family protein [Achromobacter sp. UMC46]|uniref:NADPH:quinone oxidoreductase family protein n=1 Tax=Achromobacter sp. UMC46 TaxID=1862319 RepID=UPI00160226D0|nr:NADPH:quinone oxidoreductase family protein [Achromobacter sp. UMC46]MBB1593396.1 NADPH:quinone reductase [Achromobacter sp. UMC46]
MRALICRRHGPVEDVLPGDMADAPAPGPHEVTVAVEYASVSHATKLLIQGSYQSRPPLPFAPGTEAAGRVIACGADVTRLKPGDKVVALARWGCYAERLTLPEHTVYPVPDDLPLLSALPIPISYGTAWCALLWRAAMQPGDTVLVLGAGSGVGLAAVEIASSLGATVLACASTDAKRQAALAAGAAHAFAADEDMAQAVKAASGGRGADVVIDAVGGDAFERSVRAAAANARMVSVGFASGRIPDVPLNLLLVKNIALHGFFFGRYIGWTPADERIVHAPAMQRTMSTLFDWARSKRIRPAVTAVYPITGLAAALAALESRQVVGKVAITITTETNPCTPSPPDSPPGRAASA